MKKVAILHTSNSAIRIEEGLRLSTLLRNVGVYTILGVPADSPAERLCNNSEPQWDELRSFTWLQTSSSELAKVFGLHTEYGAFVRPVDGGLDFRDCDFWLLTGGFPFQALAPLIPYGIHISDHVALLRKGTLEYVNNILRNVRSADLLLFPSEYYVNHWRSLALAHETPLLVGEIPRTEEAPEINAPYLPIGKFFAYFPTTHQTHLLPSLPQVLNSFTIDFCHLIPFEDEKVKNSRPWPQWSSAIPLNASHDDLRGILKHSEMLLTGPLVDPQDCRLKIADELEKPVLMLWDEKWGKLPDSMGNVICVHDFRDPLNIEHMIMKTLHNTHNTPDRKDLQSPRKAMPDILDTEKFVSLMVGANAK